MSNRKIDRVSRRKGRISWLLATAVALPVVVLVMGLSAATAHALLEEGPSVGTGPAEASVAPPVDAPAVVAPRAMSHIGTPVPPTDVPPTDVPPTDVPPTDVPPTEVPGALIFVGSFQDIYDFTGDTTPDCGGGTLTLTLNPDGTEIVSLSVVGFNVGAMPNNNDTEFDPPLPIAGDGTFSSSGPLPPPLEAILSTLEGTFDFAAQPLPTVSGTLTIAVVADPSIILCMATFTAEQLEAGAPTPTSAPPVATPTPTVSGLPGVGSSGGSDSTGVLWAIVAGIVGVVALGTAGVASMRRRRA